MKLSCITRVFQVINLPLNQSSWKPNIFDFRIELISPDGATRQSWVTFDKSFGIVTSYDKTSSYKRH